MRLLAADAWRFVERTGRFRKLPTPALPGSGKGYSALCGSQPYGAPVFMSAHSIRAGRQKVKPADIFRPGLSFQILQTTRRIRPFLQDNTRKGGRGPLVSSGVPAIGKTRTLFSASERHDKRPPNRITGMPKPRRTKPCGLPRLHRQGRFHLSWRQYFSKQFET